MPPKKFSQFTCVHVKSANRAEVTRVAKPAIKIEYAGGFPTATREAVREFFFEKEKKTVASSALEWESVAFPERAGTRLFTEGLRVLCRCAGSWETVVHFDNTVKPDQAKKRLYDRLTQKTVDLLPHQQVLRDEFVDYDWHSHARRAYLLYWTMGSGKTRGALAALAAAKHTSKNNDWSKVLIVCSNTLIGNWLKTIDESPQGSGYTRFVIVGYNEFRNSFHDTGGPLGNIARYIVIVDEAHYYRNLTPMMLPDVALLRRALFLFLLTGTPMQNEPDEICAMLALLQCCDAEVSDASTTTTIAAAGNNEFECDPVALVKRRAAIERRLAHDKSVFFYDPAVYDAARFSENYPATDERIERVPMSAIQSLEYIMSLRASTTIGPYTIQTARCNSYDSLTRAIANVVDPDAPADSPKVRHIVRNVLSGKFPAPHVIYSHYRDRGIHAVDKHLDDEAKRQSITLRRATISGSTEGRERDDIVALHNAGGKLDVLSFTDAAREGVDLLGTGTMHVAESAQNLHSESQTMSRVARFGSHARLPSEQQRVVFVKYHSAFPSVAALEKQRDELERHFESKYKLKARGEFDIVAALARLFKQLENGETVDERYARTNLEKAKLLTPWLDLLKRVGDRREAVAAARSSVESEASVGGGGRKPRKRLTVAELEAIRLNLVVERAQRTPLSPTSGGRKRKPTAQSAERVVKKSKPNAP